MKKTNKLSEIILLSLLTTVNSNAQNNTCVSTDNDLPRYTIEITEKIQCSPARPPIKIETEYEFFDWNNDTKLDSLRIYSNSCYKPSQMESVIPTYMYLMPTHEHHKTPQERFNLLKKYCNSLSNAENSNTHCFIEENIPKKCKCK